MSGQSNNQSACTTRWRCGASGPAIEKGETMKIYQQKRRTGQRSAAFWVTRRDVVTRYFCARVCVTADSAFSGAGLQSRCDKGTVDEITHREALDLLAHWLEGHAELAKILADDPESEFAVTDNERNE